MSSQFLDETVNLDDVDDDEAHQNQQQPPPTEEKSMEKKVILLKKVRDNKLALTQTDNEDEKTRLNKEIANLTERLETIDPPATKEQPSPPSKSEKQQEEIEEKDATVQKKDFEKQWSVLRSASTAVGFTDKILQSQHTKNRKAVDGFEDRYQELVRDMGTDVSLDDSFKSETNSDTSTKTAMKRHKPHPHIIHFIEDCQCDPPKINLLQDGDFHFANDIPLWHFKAAVDALMAGARIAGSPASFRMTRRKFHKEEVSALEDFLVGSDDIDHFSLEHIWGFDASKAYAVGLVECLAETTKLRSLGFVYVVSAERKTKKWWIKVASLVEKHKTLESIALAFTRPKPLIAHNVMERHFEQFPEILETLLLAISNNRALINVTLESVGLTMEDARMIGRIMKKLKLISLILPRNSLGRVGAEIIAKQLRTCRSIRILDLSSNNTGDSGTIAVIMACQDHPSIQSFAISANDLTSAIIPSLCDYVKSSSRLEKLDVSHNHIGRDIIKLLHAVARSQTLEVLNIGYNAGTESCVGAIKHVLVDPPKDDDEEGDPIPTAPQLTELNLEGNQLSPDAGIMIKHALKTNINILHINLEANFLIKHDIIDIEKALAVNRLGAEIKFKFRPQVLQQKWNWNAATIGTKNIRDKKIIPKRTDEDVKIERARAKQKRKRDAKNGKRGNEDGPPCSIL